MATISDLIARATTTTSSTVVPVRQGDLGPAVIITGAIAIGFTTVALLLRLYSRTQSSNKIEFWWDDWVLIITTVFSHAFLGLNMAWTRLGLGKHIEAIDTTSILPTLYISKASILIYAVCIWLIKISTLLMYSRVFRRSPKFRLTLWCFGVYVTLWFVCTAVVPWFNCTPVRKTIDPFLPGQCFDRTGWFLASAFINAITDLSILILPLPMLWSLQMTLRRKLQVSAVFLVGYCSAFLSFARFIIIVRDPTVMSVVPAADPYYHTIPLLIISMLEAPCAIVALCGPAIGQLSLRSSSHSRLTSLFSTLFRSRGSGGRSTERSMGSHLGSMGDKGEVNRATGAGDYEEMHSIHRQKDTGFDAHTSPWVEETWPSSNNSTSAFTHTRVSRRSDDSAVPLGSASAV